MDSSVIRSIQLPTPFGGPRGNFSGCIVEMRKSALLRPVPALITGQITACAGSCGPGNLHLIQGLYNSHRNRAPVFAIAGQVPSGFLGTEYFQETHPERIFRDCSHYCAAAYTAVQAVTMSRLAIQTAITKRGVGLVCIPGDTMALPAAIDVPPHPFFTDPPRIRPTDD